MKELHSQGKTIEDIVEVLKRVPIHPRVVPAIKAAHSLGYNIRHISSPFVLFILFFGCDKVNYNMGNAGVS